MAVNFAENVRDNLEGVEKARVEDFKQAPGYGGERVRVRLNYSDLSLRHVNYGSGPTQVSVFYELNGDDYKVVGVGKIARKKDGKAVYSALWEGNQTRRVDVVVLGHL
jgi:hypothetical protein